ncbi:MAG TPA: hypothetical protein ENK72_01815 [Epsilonproteobacteria bacterium]|nr:hypothetical protein [Campylobacterota bacterium]
MRSIRNYSLLVITLLLLGGCGEKVDSESLTEGAMKCGPGKCGASMVDGSAVLVKKKMNILGQLSEEDTRRACVLDAVSTKALYECVRDTETGRLTVEDKHPKPFGVVEKAAPEMKCAPGKCGSGM